MTHFSLPQPQSTSDVIQLKRRVHDVIQSCDVEHKSTRFGESWWSLKLLSKGDGRRSILLSTYTWHTVIGTYVIAFFGDRYGT